jgi:serine/threonine-protein kinase
MARSADSEADKDGPVAKDDLDATVCEQVVPHTTSDTTSSAVAPGLASFDEDAAGILPKQRYEVTERLGHGGGGQVFAVVDHHLEREVALKVMHARGRGLEKVRRFIDEARLTARLEHPNILPLYDLSSDDSGRWFFSMRRASGQTLLELIKEAAAGQVPKQLATPTSKVDIIARICDAIAYAHSRGILHRDIKPSNVILGEFGEVTVLDWGTALDLRTGEQELGKLVGTPLYMAPEQARGDAVDERADVYCLGATLWQVLTFARPAVPTDDEAEFWVHKQRGTLPEAPPGLPP